MRMKKLLIFLMALSGLRFTSVAQTPKTWSSAEILSGLEKLHVLGSVLYVAAHPDDENTRLLAWLALDRQYRTGYLSLTRGDGGQNLIGEEQGIALGLIRTQELLAARRIDGAEQFFTRAFDFGFSKSTEEALSVWNKEKILSDVVWVIRNFRPDIIITRFPPDARAGHGHHSGSAVLALEAFRAAADSTRFPEQFKKGVRPWQARRILWNTFNFGSGNTTSSDQFRVDVGTFNPLLGKGYGEIAAESRSQHKSQGFGVPAGRGTSTEYFVLSDGEPMKQSLMDGIQTNWSRIEGSADIEKRITALIQQFQHRDPSASVKGLIALYQQVEQLPDLYWKKQKCSEILELIMACSGLYLEASSQQPYVVQGDSLRFTISAINRSNVSMRLNRVTLHAFDTSLASILPNNRMLSWEKQLPIPETTAISQPYWLQQPMDKGAFQITDQELIGQPANKPSFEADFSVQIEGVTFSFRRPVWFKRTDPVKGELYQPLVVVPPVTVNTDPGILIFRRDQAEEKAYAVSVTAFTNIDSTGATLHNFSTKGQQDMKDLPFALSKGATRNFQVPYTNAGLKKSTVTDQLQASLEYRNKRFDQANYLAMATINYDHIPPIKYFYQDGISVLNLDVKTAGRKAGYIKGAGDKIPEALAQLGYDVTYLDEKTVRENLSSYDVIVTGIRAYNIHPWLPAAYTALMKYVENGGVLLVQYNTNNFAGPLRGVQLGPYDLSISNGRITDEQSDVRFPDPQHPLLNWPNKITSKDFEGWVQERGIYFGEKWASEYQPVLAMKDPGETAERMGSLLMAPYGKGRFIYTGLVFFRQLPAAVPGAYRLFANLISNPNATKK